jgi:tetratricopeptide (TPR) repeat protein
VFRREGDYWTVGYGERSYRLKDAKGLAYIAHLLRHPDLSFHVLDLVGGIPSQTDQTKNNRIGLPRGGDDLETAGLHVGGIGDAGEMLDDQAKAAYRRRLSELREELEEAKDSGNVARAEQAEEEIDALTQELSRAVGLGGRNRRAASASERARQSVTKTIKAVVERIAQSDAALGDFFSRCVRTGTFCCYQPAPDFPVAWEFGQSTVEPDQNSSSSDDTAPVPTAHPGTSLPMLEVSVFSPAERTAFVGRETECSAIRATIDRAQGGHGSLVMLFDGPGVGKTRLAMQMAEYASSKGFRCAVGRCYERDEPFPYLPFAEIIEGNLARAPSLDDFRRRLGDSAAELAQIAPSLRRVYPDIPQPLQLPPAQQRRYLFQSVSESMARAAQTRPELYILEDLHWADESTLALLVHLANRIPQLPIVIIGTYRGGYADDNPALVRTLEELIRLGVRPQKLEGLSKDNVAQMLQGLSERGTPESLVSLIFEESQGYPFFVEEVYRHLVEEGKVFDEVGRFRTDLDLDETDVPENVRLIISRRLERFDDNEKRALAAAAVIGRSFSFQLLAAISQVEVDELFSLIEKAQRMGTIVSSAEGPERPFTFRHELVRQTLLAGISTPRRQRLHAAVADAIARLDPGAAEELAGFIADHLLKAGSFADDRKLADYLTVAGMAALEASAFDEAARSFRSALKHQNVSDQGARAELLAHLATAELGLEQWDPALANYREALETYINLGDREMAARRFTELAEACIWVGRSQEAAETARRGLTYLEGEFSANRVRLLAVLGQALASRSAPEPAFEALREASSVASRLADPKLEARVLDARSIVNLHFFQLEEAASDGLLSVQLGGSDAPPWQRARQLRVLNQSLVYLGRLREALKIIDELEPLATRIGDPYSVALCLSVRIHYEFGKQPDVSKLEIGLQQVSSSIQNSRFPFWQILSEVQLSLIDHIRGDWASALSHAKAACGPKPSTSIRGFGEGTLFRQMTYAGDRDGALAIFNERRECLPVPGQKNVRGSWWMLALVVEGLFLIGERSQAGQLYPLVREMIATGTVTLWSLARFTQTIAGIAAASAGQYENAEEHFRIAMQQAESFPDQLEQAEIRRFHAMMLIDRAAGDDREKARKLLGEATDTYRSIGMPRHIEMTRALLDKITPRS